jgi:hypothetical protein
MPINIRVETSMPVEIPIPLPLPARAPPESRLQPSQPQHTGFLPAEQWQYIQDFNTAMGRVQMEGCIRCKEHWFEMDLKHNICHSCYLRDKGAQTPPLMSAENNMDPGEVPAHLPELSQVEEMIIARSHVQMMVHRYRGHQYHYTGHCVSFLQNTVKTVEILPMLPTELDIVILRPSTSIVESDQRYQRQFRVNFRVRRAHVIAWLYYLKYYHPDYQWVEISPARIAALPEDADISSSFPAIIDNTLPNEEGQTEPVLDELEPPTTQSMVPNLDVTTTEVDLIIGELSGRNTLPPGLPAPSIRQTPIDEAAGNERVFAMAFPILYLTGMADFNALRIRKVSLSEYA